MKKRTFKQQISVFTDDTRNKIICLLNINECCVSELVRILDIPQPNVSRHLDKLVLAGAVHCEIEGRNKYYRLNRVFAEKYAMEIKEVCEAYSDEIDISTVDIRNLKRHTNSRFLEKENRIRKNQRKARSK